MNFLKKRMQKNAFGGNKIKSLVFPKGTLQGYQKAISDVVRAREDIEIWNETLSIKEQ